jgi:predicted aminopeptidase
LLAQAGPLISHTAGARSFDRARSSGELSAAELELIERTEDIRTFAVQELGLDGGRSYTRFRDIEKDYLVSVVSAAEELSFERYLWRYPLVGPLPYRGYYREQAAIREAERLRTRGYDVVRRNVAAFSTLGVLADPIYSFMADWSDARLAEVLIHEMVHATVWLRGKAQFNEELATFVGQEGAVQYLRSMGTAGSQAESARPAARRAGGPIAGRTDDPAAELLDYRADLDRFREDLDGLRGELERLYARSAEGDLDAEAARAGKQKVIDDFARNFAERYEDRYLTDRFAWFSEADINNALIDLYTTYTENLEAFEDFHEALGYDLRRTVSVLREIEGARPDDPYDWLEKKSAALAGRAAE